MIGRQGEYGGGGESFEAVQTVSLHRSKGVVHVYGLGLLEAKAASSTSLAHKTADAPC